MLVDVLVGGGIAATLVVAFVSALRGARGGVVLSVLVLGALPLVLVLAAGRLLVRVAPAAPSSLDEWLPLAGVPLAVGAMLAFAVRERSALVDGFLSLKAHAAVLACALGAVLLPAPPRPEPGAWVGSLPTFARVESGRAEITLPGPVSRSVLLLRGTTPATAQTCTFFVRDGEGTQHPVGTLEVMSDGCVAEVRRDRVRDLWVVEEGRIALEGMELAPAFAFRPGTIARVELDAADVGVGAPHAWHGAARATAGVALALLLAGWVVRVRRRRGGIAGTHVGEGWIALGDGRRVHDPRAEPLPLGPLHLVLRTEGVTPYRGGRTAILRVFPGSLAERDARAHDGAASLFAAALACAVLGSAPALAAMLCGG